MHLMTDGRECGYKDGHNGQHYSLEAVDQRRKHDRERKRELLSDPEWREKRKRRRRERYAEDPAIRERIAERNWAWRYLTVIGATRDLRSRNPELAEIVVRELRQQLSERGIEA